MMLLLVNPDRAPTQSRAVAAGAWWRHRALQVCVVGRTHHCVTYDYPPPPTRHNYTPTGHFTPTSPTPFWKLAHTAYYATHFGIARSVRLSVPWRSCLGYRHAGCRQADT